MLFSHATAWTSRAVAANAEKDVLTTATDLTAGASYLGGGTPGATWDVTFTNATYGATTFTVNANLTLGTLNNLNATQALIITNTNTGGGIRTLTLSGGGDTVPGSASTDLIFLGANGSLTIQNGTRTLGLALAANGDFDTAFGASLVINSVISGNFNLAKTGAGTLTLGGANTFGGAGKTFTLSGGTLNLNAAAALGNAGNTFVIGGGTTIDNTSGAAITTSNYGVTINGDFTFTGGGTTTTRDLNLGTGAVTLGTTAGTTRTITTIAANSTLRFGGVIANGTTANAIIKGGAGILTFSGTAANTFTGGVTVNAGTLVLTKSANVNAIAGGTLQIGNGTGSATVQLGANEQLANTVSVDVRSSGTFNLANFSETIAALTLQSDTAQAASITTGTGTLTLGGDVTLNTTGTGATGATFTGNLNLGNAARTFTVAKGSASPTADLTISGVISSTTAASGAFVKTGAGILTFSGTAANTYTGMTTVNAGELDLNKSAGVLAVAGNLTIGDGTGGANSDIVKLLANGQIATTAAVFVNGSSGKLDLNGFTQTIASLADTGTVTANGSSVNLGAGALTVGDATSTTFSGNITGTGGSLVKNGAGTLSLGGTNTYTGTTTMNAGTISLNASAAFPTSGNLTMLGGTFDIRGQSPTVNNIVFGDGVSTTATTLADSGTVKGAINLNGTISYYGTSARTFPASIVNTAIVLSSGIHSITNPNGFYSPAANYDIVFNGVISGSGGISKDGVNTLFWIAFNAQNTYTGPTNITAGKLFLGVANAIPSGSAVTVSAGATLSLTAPTTEVGVTAGNYAQSIGSIAGAGTIDLGSATLTTGTDNTSTTFSGTLIGTGGLTKVGTGTQTLSGASTYTGATTVSAGKLLITGSVTGTTITVNPGGSVAGPGAFGSSTSATGGIVNVGGGSLDLVDGAINTLTVTGNSSGAATVTLILGGAVGVSSAINLETGATSTDKVVVLQKAQVNAGGAVINLTPLAGTVLAAGTYPLVTFASDTLTGAYSLSTAGYGGFAYTLSHTATAQNLVVTAVATPAVAYWNGGAGAQWNTFGTGATPTNWFTTAGATTNTLQVPGATTDVFFTTTSGATNLTNTLGADFSIKSLNFTAGSASANIGGTNTLTIGTGGVTSASGAAEQTLSTNLALGAAQTWTNDGGTLTVSGTSITGSGMNLALGGSGDFAISAALQTGAGSLTKNGAGTLTLSGASTFTGGMTLTGGMVIAGHNSAFSTGSIAFTGGTLASNSGTRSLANSIVVNNVSGNQITGSNSVTLTGVASGGGTLEVNFSDNTKSVIANPTATNSFAPATVRLTSGTLLLGGANKIGDNTAVNFNGGTLNTGGFSDTVGALTLTANSALDFGTTNNVHLQFSSAAWTGGALTVNNWTGTEFATGNPDQFLVASAGPLDSGFLGQILFTGHGNGAIAFNVGGGLYEIVPVPEPATIFGAIGLVAFVGFRERRRVARMFRKAA